MSVKYIYTLTIMIVKYIFKIVVCKICQSWAKMLHPTFPFQKFITIRPEHVRKNNSHMIMSSLIISYDHRVGWDNLGQC